MINHLLYLCVGAIEWALAIFRIQACVKGLALVASSLVLVETMLGLWVFRQYAAGNDSIGIFYALGGAFGTFLSVFQKKSRRNATPEFIKFV
jgi:membrane associated rhomboid family serine protease